jgi:hypothetical protein
MVIVIYDARHDTNMKWRFDVLGIPWKSTNIYKHNAKYVISRGVTCVLKLTLNHVLQGLAVAMVVQVHAAKLRLIFLFRMNHNTSH